MSNAHELNWVDCNLPYETYDHPINSPSFKKLVGDPIGCVVDVEGEGRFLIGDCNDFLGTTDEMSAFSYKAIVVRYARVWSAQR